MAIPELQPAPVTLATLRRDIDGLDDALLDLIERRVAASAAVAALKDREGSGLLKLRPRREAEVVDRLQRKASGAPPEMIAHVWRTLMSYGVQAQTPMRLVVHAAGDRPVLQERVRARFGPAAQLCWAADADEALAAARDGEAVAILDEDGEAMAILSEDGARENDAVRVFDTIAIPDGRRLCALGRVAPEDVVQGLVR